MIISQTENLGLPSTNSVREKVIQWSDSPFPTIPSSDAFMQRLSFIKKRIANESWLPSQFVKRFDKTCRRINSLARKSALNPENAQKVVEELAAIAYFYDDLTLQSSTLCQIRALDMEMNEERYKQLSPSSYMGGISA